MFVFNIITLNTETIKVCVAISVRIQGCDFLILPVTIP